MIVWCVCFGVVGLAGELTTFLVRSSLDDPIGPIHLDSFVNIVLGTCCIASAGWASRRAPRSS